MKRSYNGYQPFRTLATFHFDHPHSLPLAFYVSSINKKLPEISKALLKKEVGELAGGGMGHYRKGQVLGMSPACEGGSCHESEKYQCGSYK